MCHRLPQRGLPSTAQPRARMSPLKASRTGWRAAGRALLFPSNFGPSVPAPRGLCSFGLDSSALAGSGSCVHSACGQDQQRNSPEMTVVSRAFLAMVGHQMPRRSG